MCFWHSRATCLLHIELFSFQSTILQRNRPLLDIHDLRQRLFGLDRRRHLSTFIRGRRLRRKRRRSNLPHRVAAAEATSTNPSTSTGQHIRKSTISDGLLTQLPYPGRRVILRLRGLRSLRGPNWWWRPRRPSRRSRPRCSLSTTSGSRQSSQPTVPSTRICHRIGQLSARGTTRTKSPRPQPAQDPQAPPAEQQ
jgi:hypothetical protein